MPQTLNSSVDRYRFMHAPCLETSLAALEQADLIIGIQPSIAQPVPPQIVVPGHGIAIGTRGHRLLLQSRNLLTQPLAHSFIGIKAENPVASRERDRGILRRGIAFPRTAIDVWSIFRAQFQGTVNAARIHDDDFICPTHRLQAVADLCFLITRDDRHRQLIRG
jgi:hypothetical protein